MALVCSLPLLTCVCPLLLLCFSCFLLPFYCSTFPSDCPCFYLFLYPQSTSPFLSQRLPFLLHCSICRWFSHPFPCPHLCVSGSCFALSSLWNSSGGCPSLLPTTVEGCINIACHCLIDHSNARNTEPATRQVSGSSGCLHTQMQADTHTHTHKCIYSAMVTATKPDLWLGQHWFRVMWCALSPKLRREDEVSPPHRESQPWQKVWRNFRGEMESSCDPWIRNCDDWKWNQMLFNHPPDPKMKP